MSGSTESTELSWFRLYFDVDGNFCPYLQPRVGGPSINKRYTPLNGSTTLHFEFEALPLT
jgi:hypothetical protein